MVQKFLNNTALRIADPTRTLSFYEKFFGMSQLAKFQTPGATSYLLGLTGPQSLNKNAPFYSRNGLLRLVHHDNDTTESFTVNNGNKEPYRGFGHICFSVADIEQTCAKLEEEGVKFQKRLVDGRQKNIAFALDPDGYWIELIGNGKSEADKEGEDTSRLNHSMIRVKDRDASLDFYTKKLGLTLVDTADFPGAEFTLYFLSFDPEQVKRDGRANAESLVELTYNYGSEKDDTKYHTGSAGGPQGFLSFGVTTNEPEALVKELSASGVKVSSDESTPGTTVYDPDGYAVDILPLQDYAKL